MIAKELILKNILSHKNTKITFKEDFYTILGEILGTSKSNGSGKSVIPNGIGFALFGDIALGIKNDDAIHNNEKEMSVDYAFELNKIDYVISRFVKRGSTPIIKIAKNGEKPVKYKIKEGQEEINRILGANFDTFRKTSYFKQGDLNAFSKLTPKEAKEVVIKLLQLDAYNKFEDRAKAKSNEVTKEITDVNAKIGQLEGMIKYEESIKKSRIYSNEDLINAQNSLNYLKEKKDKHDSARGSWAEKSSEVSEKVRLQKVEIQKIQFAITPIEKRINKLKALSGKCPTCEHTISDNEINIITLSLEKDIEEINKSKEPLELTLKEYETNAKIVEDMEPELYRYYDNDIIEISKEIGEITAELKQAQSDEYNIKKYKANLVKGNSVLVEKQELLAKYEQLKQAFGKNGIQAFIIENVIPEIQATTNDILEGLDTDIRVIIESQKELKKGGKSETLDIKVLTEFGERPYTNYSGGEKTFIDFALRIALSIILTRRSECQIQTLILDEVFGELDTVNKQIIAKALRFIANRFNFKKILIISHAEELQESFGNVIRVVFNGTESKITEQ